MTRTPLTATDLDRMTDEGNGFGYLGARRRELTGGDPEAPARPALVADVDSLVLGAANRQGMTYAELFAWADSKAGRWFADCMFGGTPQHAQRYLPVK